MVKIGENRAERTRLRHAAGATKPYHDAETVSGTANPRPEHDQPRRVFLWRPGDLAEPLRPTTSAFLKADVAALIAHIRAPRWIGHPGAFAPQAVGWRGLSRASEQVDHLLDSLKPRLLIFDEFHSALRARKQDVKAIFTVLQRIARVHDISLVLVGEIAVYDALNDTEEMDSRFDTIPVPR